MLIAYALAGIMMLVVAVSMFGLLGLVAWLAAMVVTYWYGKKQGWL